MHIHKKTEANWNFIVDGYNGSDLGDAAIDSNGNSYIGVNYYDELEISELKKTFPSADHAIAIIKLDENGKTIWGLNLESAKDCRINSMTIAPNGDLIITGFFDGIGTFPSIKKKPIKRGFPNLNKSTFNPSFLFIARYTPEGECVWAKALHQGFGQSKDVKVNSKGEIYWSFYHLGTLRNGNVMLDFISGPKNKKDPHF